MKLHENQAEQHSSGLEGAKTMDFKIQMGAKAFAVTIDKLYMDKVKAFVREYSTNGVDANPPGMPIEVHMPSLYEPFFSVTDFGTGLAENQMEDIFCVLFKSTKDDSNDQIGALGLGCKSGFAYTDQFTVESRHGGKKTTYTATRSDGMPKMIKLVEVPLAPGEKTGLTISIPVKTPDIPLVEHAARQVYSYFKVPPKFTHKPVTLEQRGIPIVSGTFWRYYEPPKSTGYGQPASVFSARAVAVMGQIAYPIDVAAMSPHLTPAERALLECPIELDVQMGEVDIQPSREGLSYDKATIATLQVRLQAISKAVSENFIKPFRDVYKTGWDKAVNYARAWSKLSYHIQQTISAEMRKLVPHGNRLEVDAVKLLGLTGKMAEAPNAGNRYSDRRLAEKWYGASSYHGGKASFRLHDETVVVIVDQIPRYIDKIMHFYKGKDLIMIMPDPKVPFDPANFGDVPDDKVVRTSELELPVTVLAQVRARSVTRKVLSFRNNGWLGGEVSRNWDDGGIYLKRESGSILHPPAKTTGSIHRFSDVSVQWVLNSGLIKHDEVFAINKAFWKQLTEENGWLDFYAVLKERLETSTMLKEAVALVAQKDVLDKLQGIGGGIAGIITKLPKGRKYGPTIETAQELLAPLFTTSKPSWTMAVSADHLVDMATELGIKLPVAAALDKKLESAIKDVREAYPMLEVLTKNIYGRTLDEIVEGRNVHSKAVLDYLK